MESEHDTVVWNQDITFRYCFYVSRSSRSGDLYHLEFTFDADVDCRFTIYNFLPDSVDLETLRNE